MTARNPPVSLVEPADKLASLQRFAAGLVHDLNNKLTIMIGNLDLVEMDIEADSAAMCSVAEVRSAVDQIQAIVRFLTDFAIPPPLAAESVSVPEAIADVVRRHPETTFRQILSGSPCLAKCDRQELCSILDALVSNAEWAGDRRTIELAARRVESDMEIDTYFRPLPPGRYIEILVRDSGCGMSDETLKFLFDPYFSCSPSKRRGLGLAMVPGMVAEMGGGIAVESSPETGSTFHLWLPSVDGGARA